MPPPDASPYDVAVIGAGFSGLNAALTLARESPHLRLVLLEGRRRIGGRTESTAEGIDVGGQWIGALHGRLLSLVKRYDIKLLDQYYPPTSNSTRLTECVGYTNPPMTTEDVAQLAEFTATLARLCEKIDVDRLWDTDGERMNEWDNMSVADFIGSQISSPGARKEALLFAQTVLACDPSKISTFFFLFYIVSSGGMESLGDGENGAQKWRVSGGIGTIARRMSSEIASTTTTLLDFPVEEVRQEPDFIRIISRNHQHQDVWCRKVILAIPPGLWGKMRFSPSLSVAKSAMARTIVPGHAVKVIVGYPQSFWLNSPKRATSDENTCETLHFTEHGPVHNVFHAQYNPETYALVGLITGNAAETFECQPEGERRRIVLAQFVKMYGEEAKHPTLYLERLWAKEEFSGGCFAGIAPPDGSFSSLGKHLCASEGNIHFASTETSTRFYGYIEGALAAGERAAREVISGMRLFSLIHN